MARDQPREEREKAGLAREPRRPAGLGFEDRGDEPGRASVVDDRGKRERTPDATTGHRLGGGAEQLGGRVQASIGEPVVARRLHRVRFAWSDGAEGSHRSRVELAAVAKAVRAPGDHADGVGRVRVATEVRARVDGLDQLDPAQLLVDADPT